MEYFKKDYSTYDAESRKQMEIIDIRSAIQDLDKRLQVIEIKPEKDFNPAITHLDSRISKLENKPEAKPPTLIELLKDLWGKK